MWELFALNLPSGDELFNKKPDCIFLRRESNNSSDVWRVTAVAVGSPMLYEGWA